MNLSSEPAVSLRIECSGSLIHKVDLSLHPFFSCEIQSAEPQLEKAILTWLAHYAEKKPTPLPPIFFLEYLSSFHRKVLEQMEHIVFGETKSYRELGKMAGYSKANQAVGGACKRNPFPLFFPCHRVISSNGSIGGFALDLRIKERLLAFEGVIPLTLSSE